MVVQALLAACVSLEVPVVDLETAAVAVGIVVAEVVRPEQFAGVGGRVLALPAAFQGVEDMLDATGEAVEVDVGVEVHKIQ